MSASERLTLSRERMRQAMINLGATGSQTDQANRADTLPDWISKLRETPAATVLVSVLEGWWARQPSRVILTLAAETGTVMLQPIAQKHPFKLVLGAAAAGGLLAVVRPWHWLPTSTLMAGLIPQLLSAVTKRRNGPH